MRCMESENKVVSIVVPVYNREGTLVRCLDSIAAQAGVERYCLVLVDNNSRDRSMAVMRQWASENAALGVSLLTESRQGASVARNAGLAVVTTPYVMFFDSDDVMLPGHLKRLLDGIAAHRQADVLCWDILCELPDGRKYRAQCDPSNIVYNQIIGSVLSTQRYAAKTDFIRGIGGWDGELPGWNDYELGVRVALSRPAIVKLADPEGRPLVRTYFTDNSITGATFSSAPAKWEMALEKIEAEVMAGCPAAVSLVGYRRAVLAGLYAREGAQDEGRRLLASAPTSGFGRRKAWLVYTFTRVFGRGARLVASPFLPKHF